MIKILPLMGLIRFQVFYKLVQYEFQDIRVWDTKEVDIKRDP